MKVNEMKRPFRNLIDCKGGAALIEFALVFPLLLVMLLGILAYGIYFGAAHSTAQLAAEAARATVAGLSDSERTSLAEIYIANHAASYPVLDASKITVEAAAKPGDPNEFLVAIRYDASELPIWHFAAFLPLPSKTIERPATVKRGG